MRRALALLAAAGALAVATAAPAAAHAGDPTLVTRLNAVTPALPEGASVALRTSIADEVVARNTTSTPLEVLDADGVPFLRISAAGVEGNTGSEYFHVTPVPPGIRPPVPPTVGPGAEPVWVPLSEQPEWSWFDPRLSPEYNAVPVGGRQDVADTEELATWSVPLRYGRQDIAVEGALVRRPITGRFETVLDPPPPGITAVVGQGYVPSLSVQAASGRTLTVLGRDGAEYVRFAADGRGEVNRDSATYRDDLLARGRPVTPDDVGWAPLPGSSATWLEVRLRFPAEDPPADVAGSAVPVDVARVEVPVLVDGAPAALTGAVRWIPTGQAADGSSLPVALLAGGALLLVAAGAALVLRNRRLVAGSPDPDPDPDNEKDTARAPQPTP